MIMTEGEITSYDWTSPVWDHVDWPFEWDLSEGGPGIAPSWKVAYEDWLVRLEEESVDPESALRGLVETLRGHIEDLIDRLDDGE